MRRSALRKGDRVAVLGLGVMGMLHLLVARERGAELIIGLDRIEARVARASSFGADLCINVEKTLPRDVILDATNGEGAEIVFVTPGSRAVLEAAVGCVAPGGSLVVFTPLAPGELWPIAVNDLFFKDINIVMSYSAGPDDTREALRLLEGGLPVDGLFTHRFGLEQAAEAYKMMKNQDVSLKVIVYPNETKV